MRPIKAEAIHEARSRLDSLSSVRDIDAVHDAILTLSNVAAGLMAQPRFWDSKNQKLTAAGRAFDALLSVLNFEVDDLAKAMENATPKDDWEKVMRDAFLISHEIYGGADASQIADLAARLAATKH